MPGHDIHFLSVNHDKYVPFADVPVKNNPKLHLVSMSQPRSKPGHLLDLYSLQDQLPPNTGPPGTVPVNGSLGSAANANKNLSHVPCKFFRQGNCQAGNSCPFSHNFDGSLAADKLPCKYFQKGNCKFGLKCALAHFLPDGTRVNSKSFRRHERNSHNLAAHHDTSSSSENNSLEPSNYQNHQSKTHAGHSASSGSGSGSRNSHSGSKSSPTDRNLGRPKMAARELSGDSEPARHYDPTGDIGRASQTEPVHIRNRSFGEDSAYANSAFRNSLNSSLLTLQLAYYNGRPKPFSLTSPITNYQSLHDWLVSGTPATTSFLTGTQNGLSSKLRSLSSTSPTNLVSLPNSIDFSSNLLSSGRTDLPQDHFGLSSRLGLAGKSNSAFLSSPSNQQLRPFEELAILDDSREDAVEDDENAFFEDYVPASLGDLILTPQELQRRDSRSQSGTLWVRPNIEGSLSDIKKSYGQGHDNDVFLME